MGDVNFDEFQAIRRRKAQDDEEDEDTKEEPPATPKEEEEEPDGLAERAGAFAELPEVQLLLCVAILADVAGAAVTAARDDGAPAFLVRAAAAFPGFVNFLYAFELLALATAFKLRMLTHPGLLLDVGIVSARRRRPMVYWRVDGVFGAALSPWPFTLSTSGRRQLGSTGFGRHRRGMSGRRRRGSNGLVSVNVATPPPRERLRDDAVAVDHRRRSSTRQRATARGKKTKKTKHRPSSPPTPKATPTRSASWAF